MLKVYFDHNVYSDISKELDDEFIDKIVQLSKKDVLFFYSQAHLNDLSSDSTEYKFKELKVIERIADNNFLHLDTESDHIVNSQILATEAFNRFGMLQNNVGQSLRSVFDKTGDPLIDLTISLSKLQPIDLGEGIEEILNRKETDKAKVTYVKLGITKRKYNLGEWILIYTTMMDKLENDPSLLKEIRRSSMQYLNVDKFDLKIGSINFDENLRKSKLGKSFEEMLIRQMSFLPENLKSHYLEFITGFNMINFLGLDYERNKKVKFKSTQNDAQHTYFGSFSNIIVSRDDGLLNKAKFIYKYYDIDTKIMSTDEFVAFAKIYRSESYLSESLFLSNLYHLSKSSFIITERRPIIKHNQNEQVRKLPKKFWGLFNRLSEVGLNESDDQYLLLSPSHSRSNNILFYKEVNYIISSLDKMLHGSHDKLNDEDKTNIKAGSWNGIYWKTSYCDYWLRYSNDTRRLLLQIGPFDKEA